MKPNELTLLSRLLGILSRWQREQELRLSVSETALHNITMRLEYAERENLLFRAALVELWPLVRSAPEYATPPQLWAIEVAREQAKLEGRND
jgi:hypothetical protein